MGLFSIFRRQEPELGVETRGNTFVNFTDVFPTGANTNAGVYVDQSSALTLPAVWRCVSLNAETIASLPVDCFQKRNSERISYPPPSWLARPSRDYSWFDFICEVQTSLELDGNAFVLKVVGRTGRVVDLILLPPLQVGVERSTLPGTPLVYTLTNGTDQKVYASTEIIHIRAMTQPCQVRGMSPITYLAQTTGLGLAAGEFAARYFGDGAVLSGVISVTGNMKPEDAERLQESFKKRHGGVTKSHALGVLTGGATWTPLSVNPEESQFLETQKFTAQQIASFYGIPPEYVTEAEGAKGYVTGLYARQMLWLQTGLLPRIKRLETAFSALLPEGVYLRFNVDGLLRADPAERAALCSTMIQHQAMTPNEWRALEELNPLPGGDTVLQSVQFSPEVIA
jgi:HK97 family phage portal protein